MSATLAALSSRGTHRKHAGCTPLDWAQGGTIAAQLARRRYARCSSDVITPHHSLTKLCVCLLSAMMSLDGFHGMVSKDFVQKLRYPRWFATVLGAYKLTQAALNWVAGGALAPMAQAMMCVQLGGAIFTHVVAEGKGWAPQAVAGPSIFFCTTIAITSLTTDIHPPLLLFGAACLASVGYMSGYAIRWLGPGGSTAEELSPVKWRRKRGFSAAGEKSQ